MTTLSREEYLKRYLSPQENNERPKKKRKKKLDAVKNVKGFKIVDDDVSWDSFAPKPDEFDEVNDKLLTVDEKPLIENIDVRTEEEKKLDEYRKNQMWKRLGADDEEKKQGGDRGHEKHRHKKSKRKKRRDSDSDMDDVPRNSRRDRDSDLNDLPRHSGSSRNRTHDSDSDLDVARPSRRTADSDSDMDIPRSSKRQKQDDSDSDFDVQRSRTSSKFPNKSNMQGGGQGGLTSVDLLRLEMKKLEKRESAIKVMADEYKNTATVYRERGSHKKRDMAKEKEQSEEEQLRKKRKEDQYDKWARGLKQAELRDGAIADTIHESNKSFTRYNDDEDLEAMRKSDIRQEDPMAAYFRKKQSKKEGNVKERPKYRGPAPAPNRFGVMPGYRWDGVDRSNGFEKRYFENQSDNQAFKDEYYKWSVNDL